MVVVCVHGGVCRVLVHGCTCILSQSPASEQDEDELLAARCRPSLSASIAQLSTQYPRRYKQATNQLSLLASLHTLSAAALVPARSHHRAHSDSARFFTSSPDNPALVVFLGKLDRMERGRPSHCSLRTRSECELAGTFDDDKRAQKEKRGGRVLAAKRARLVK